MRSQTTTLVLVALAMLGVCVGVWLLLTSGKDTALVGTCPSMSRD